MCTCMCVSAYTYVSVWGCVPVSTCICVGVGTHACPCTLWRSTSGVFLHHCPPHCLRQALPLHLELINSARLAPESSCFPLAPSSGVTDTHTMTDFMWALEIQSQVLVLLQQALNQLSLLSSTVIAAF